MQRPVTLRGANRATTVVVPLVSAPNPCTGSTLCGGLASTIILVQADNVTIRDLTLDGDNPTKTSDIVRGGADLDARNGIVVDNGAGTFNGLEVRNCTVRNIYLRGMNATTGGTFNLHDNTVTNVQGDYYSIGMFAYGGPGTMAGNTASYCNDAISANHSKGIQFLNNVVSHSASGIHTDNSGDGGGVADVIKGNTVSDGGQYSYGIWTFVPYLAPVVEENTVTNCDVGLSAWGGAFAPSPTVVSHFLRNTVTGNHASGGVGIYITTDTIGYGYTDVSVDLQNNFISDYETGIYLTADQQSWNPKPWVSHTITATITNNSITGNTTWVDKGTQPTDAEATCNWWGTASANTISAQLAGKVTSYSPWLVSGTDNDLLMPGFQPARRPARGPHSSSRSTP